MKLRILLLLGIFISNFAISEPTCSLESKKKLYRLDLTVPATFCKADTKQDPSCEVFPKKSLIQLHGLWPNYEQGYPEGTCSTEECVLQDEKLGKYCLYPQPPGLYSSDIWASYQGYMAGTEKCLERHEWVKHGTCSKMDAVDYFTWGLEKTQKIVNALSITPDQETSQDELNRQISNTLPELDGAVRFNCKNDNLLGVYILFEWGDKPGLPIKTQSGKNHFGNCKNTIVVPSRQ